MTDRVTVLLDNGETHIVSAAYAEQKKLEVVETPTESPLSDEERAELHLPEMREFVRVRLADGTEVSQTRAYAKIKGLTPIEDKPAADKAGRPYPPKPRVQMEDLKGKALDKALEDAGLPKSGTVDEKRQRLADATNNTEVSS